MDKHAPGLPSTVLAATLAGALVVLASPVLAAASPNPSSSVAARQGAASVVLAQAEGDQPRELQPRYEPAPPQQRSTYNDEYIFGLTRSVADSTMHPAAKILLFPITVPFDLAFLPFEAIGGLFPK